MVGGPSSWSHSAPGPGHGPARGWVGRGELEGASQPPDPAAPPDPSSALLAPSAPAEGGKGRDSCSCPPALCPCRLAPCAPRTDLPPALAPEGTGPSWGPRHWQTQNLLFPFSSEFIRHPSHCRKPSCSRCQAFQRYLSGKCTAAAILIRNAVLAATAVRKIRQQVPKSRHSAGGPGLPAQPSPRGNAGLCGIQIYKYTNIQIQYITAEMLQGLQPGTQSRAVGAVRKTLKQAGKCPSS